MRFVHVEKLCSYLIIFLINMYCDAHMEERKIVKMEVPSESDTH